MLSSKPLTRAGLDEASLGKLTRSGFLTMQQVVDLDPLVLCGMCDMSLVEAQATICKVSEKLGSRPVTALQMLQQRMSKRQFLPTGLASLDRAMGGGLLVGCISEVCGPPGVGKTQLCLSTSVQAIAQRMREEGVEKVASHATVFYIDTESKFDAQRLRQIARLQHPDLFPDTRGGPNVELDALLSTIRVIQPSSTAELVKVLHDMQQEIIRNGTRLVVVDSVAALPRQEQMLEAEREATVLVQSTALKMLAELCGCCVLATNQVMAFSGFSAAAAAAATTAELDNEYGDIIVDNGTSYRPAMGTVWQHCVTTRITATNSNPTSLAGTTIEQLGDRPVGLDPSDAPGGHGTMALSGGGQWAGYDPASGERESPGAAVQGHKGHSPSLSSSGIRRAAPPTVLRLEKSALTSTMGTVFRYAIREGGFVEFGEAQEAMELAR